MTETNFIGNTTTIIKWFSMMLAGAMIGTLTAHGLNLNIPETTLTEVISAIIMLTLGYIDSKYPNTFSFLGNNTPAENGSPETINEIEDIDPASEYDDQ